jgi:pyruvate-formate lyase-activating enzyme
VTPSERQQGLFHAPRLVWNALARGRYEFLYDRMPMTAAGMPMTKRLNLVKAGINLLHRKLWPWAMPLHMQFELTNYCNLRCPLCPTGTRMVERKAQAMDVALFEQVMREVGPYLLTTSLWGWGEPLLHPRLKEILRAARGHGVITMLSTNGQRLNDDHVVEALIDEPPDYLIVALDGLTDETNSVFRAGARVAPVLEGVKKLAEGKRRHGLDRPVLNMRFIVMKHNQHEAPELRSFAARHGFEMLSVRELFFIDSVCGAGASERLSPEHAGNTQAVSTPNFICQQPFWFPSVLADGTMVLCEQDYNGTLSPGRIDSNTSFTSLWRSARAAEMRRQIRDHSEDIGFCRKCPYLGRPATDFNSGVEPLVAEVER